MYYDDLLSIEDAVKKVSAMVIQSVSMSDNELTFIFQGGATLKMRDNGQSCCEIRYMDTDDDLSEFNAGRIHKIELKDGSRKWEDYEAHDIQFLDVTTTQGFFQIKSHNEHNGWYSGFSIECKLYLP